MKDFNYFYYNGIITIEDYKEIIRRFSDKIGGTYLNFTVLPEYHHHHAWNMIYRGYGRTIANFWLGLYKKRFRSFGKDYDYERLEVMKE